MKRPIEPGLLRLFRYFSLLGFVYFSARWVYNDVAATQNEVITFQTLSYIVIHGLLFIILSFPIIERRLKDKYLPFILTSYTLLMIAGNWLFLLEPDPSVPSFITQSYTLVPILIVPVVFIAWQYSLKIVMLYAAVTNLSDFLITFMIVDDFSLGNISLLSLPIIRGFTFMLVGFIVDQLNEQQRLQKHKLVLANIQLGQYANTLESLAISRERNRLARELHDTLAHTLSGISVNLEALKTMIPEEADQANIMIDRSLADARQGLANTRRALQDLRAQPLEDLGLELALQALIENLAERQGIETEFLFTSPILQLPPNVEQAFYRIGQESIENISEHANANKIFFELDEQDGLVHMEIRDDGVGFDFSSKPEPGHYGIQGMKERATSIGAELEMESQLGVGTTVRLLWERLI